MPYESPIEIISQQIDDMINKVAEERENKIVANICEQIHVNVDKEELLKALAYDRNQYNKGYDDARRIFSASVPLYDAVHTYLLTHTTTELLEVVLEAIKEYER